MALEGKTKFNEFKEKVKKSYEMTNVCQFCLEKKNDLLQCAACGTVQYCNRTCQKSDWKSHKKNCVTYKPVNIEGKGIGLLATKNIKQGELIIREKAVVIIPFNQNKQVKMQIIVTLSKLTLPRPKVTFFDKGFFYDPHNPSLNSEEEG